MYAWDSLWSFFKAKSLMSEFMAINIKKKIVTVFDSATPIQGRYLFKF